MSSIMGSPDQLRANRKVKDKLSSVNIWIPGYVNTPEAAADAFDFWGTVLGWECRAEPGDVEHQAFRVQKIHDVLNALRVQQGTEWEAMLVTKHAYYRWNGMSREKTQDYWATFWRSLQDRVEKGNLRWKVVKWGNPRRPIKGFWW